MTMRICPARAARAGQTIRVGIDKYNNKTMEKKIYCPACGKEVDKKDFLQSVGICNDCYEVYEIEMNELIDARSDHDEYINSTT
jgi:acetyl-CoA carboxylase beta subunit